jgi:hypothetical protein
MATPPRKDSLPAGKSEPPTADRQQRVQRSLALVQRMSSGRTQEGFAMHAVCVKCGANVADWRDHVMQKASRPIYATESGEFTARLEYDGACSACGGRVVEIRAEGHR